MKNYAKTNVEIYVQICIYRKIFKNIKFSYKLNDSEKHFSNLTKNLSFIKVTVLIITIIISYSRTKYLQHDCHQVKFNILLKLCFKSAFTSRTKRCQKHLHFAFCFKF